MTIADLATLPEHVAAVQMLILRCETSVDRKHLIVAAGCAGAISPEEAHLLITANQLETA